MTVLEEGLVAYLKATGTVTAVVSTRIYPFSFPDGVTMPCVTYQRIDTPRIFAHDTTGATGTLASPRIQFDVWAETYSEAKSITDILRAAVNGKSGAMGAGAVTVTISVALIDAEAPEKDLATGLYRCRSDYLFWYEE